MRSSIRLIAAIFVTVLPCALAACGSRSANIVPNAAARSTQSATNSMLRALPSTALVKAGSLFVAGNDKRAVEIFEEFGGTAPIGSISKGLVGSGAIALDGSNNLFDTAGPDNTVVEFVPPYKGNPVASFSTGAGSMNAPTGVTIAPDGTLYASEIAGGPFGTGQVVVFDPNSRKISRVLSDATFPSDMTTDAKGNLFVSVDGPADVEEYAPGSVSGTRLNLKGVQLTSGVALDDTGNLLVVDEACTVAACSPRVDVFPAGKRVAARTIGLGRFTFAKGLALSRDGTRLFVGDSESSAHPSTVFVFAYPSGTLLERIQNQGFDVAVTR